MRKCKNSKQFLPKIVILSLLIVIYCSILVHAKYVHTETLSGSGSITADIGSITVLEHTASRQEDGSYILLDDTTEENTYLLIPGLDIPKDAFVQIDKSSPIEVYVFVEILEDSAVDCIAWNTTSDWTELAGITGDNGGKVYVYKEILTAFSGKISIFESDTIEIKQNLSAMNGQSVTIHIWASMYQTAVANTPAEVYAHNHPQN